MMPDCSTMGINSIGRMYPGLLLFQRKNLYNPFITWQAVQYPASYRPASCTANRLNKQGTHEAAVISLSGSFRTFTQSPYPFIQESHQTEIPLKFRNITPNKFSVEKLESAAYQQGNNFRCAPLEAPLPTCRKQET